MDSGAATGMEARTRPAAGQLCTEKSAGLARRPTERLAEPLKAQPFRQPGEPIDRSLGILKIVLYLVPTQLLWYEVEHNFENAEASVDRLAWLAERLRLKGFGQTLGRTTR